MFVISTIALAGIVFLLCFRLLFIKKEMRRITEELLSKEDESNICVDFIDRDLQRMVLEINNLYERILRIKAENREEEKMLRESVSMISHDMRTPLTSVIGYLQVAKKSRDKEEILQNLDIALERAKYLNRLVNDFFELSLIESGQLEGKQERVNVSELICEEILAESPAIDAGGIEPVFPQADENIYVMADRKLLTRVIQNLTSNAVKYSDGKLEFRLEELAGASRIAMTILSSTAQEIETDKIFRRFYKEDSARSKGGAGLGLYIVKCFVECMNGRVRAEKEGEEFRVIVELEKA